MKYMIRDIAWVLFFLIITTSLFTMWRRRPLGELAGRVHLVPTDAQTMQELELCPLFTPEDVVVDFALLEELENDLRRQGVSEIDIEHQLSSLQPVQGLKYHVFDEQQLAFVERIAPVNSPCVVALGNVNECDRFLVQYKSLNQFELAQKTSLSPALCAGHALNNARFIGNYAKTGEIKYLLYLHDLQRSGNFLLDFKVGDWVNVDVVQRYISQMKKELTITFPIWAISSALLFDPYLQEQPGFALVDSQEYDEVQLLRKTIGFELEKNNYVAILIIGNEEFSIEHGHYFTFAIIKSGDIIQYVVLDTMPNVYHLQEGSHERDRLMFIIDNIEQGMTDVSLVNIRELLLQMA